MLFKENGWLVKAMQKDGDRVYYAVDLKEFLGQLMVKRNVMPPAMVHLGEACMAAVLLEAYYSKSNEKLRLDLQWTNNGPFGQLYVDCMEPGKVRGVIQNQEVYVDHLRESMGEGRLGVRRQMPNADPISGFVESGGWVGQDIVHYLQQSEQQSTRIFLHVNVTWDDEKASQKDFPFCVSEARGLLVHFLPCTDKGPEEMVQRLKDFDADMELLGPFSKWAAADNDSLERARKIIELVSFGKRVEFSPAQKIEHYCPCSEERAARTLALLSARELKQMKGDNPDFIEIKCEYCGEVYKIVHE